MKKNINLIWKNFKDFRYPESKDKKVLEKIINYKSDNKQLIEVKNLAMEYKKGKHITNIFSNVSFSINENEIIALLGNNGAGKTTIVEIISRIKKQTDGEIIYHFDNEKNTSNIGVQFQDLSFPKGLTVKDFINFQISLSKNLINEEFLFQILKTFKLNDLLNYKVSKLSGGQQQRLNVLIAMMAKPRVLFLDEFTTGLDIAVKNEIKEFIMKYCKENKITIVLISHDIDIIEQMATRFIMLSDGEMVVDTNKDTIIKNFKTVSNFLFEYIR